MIVSDEQFGASYQIMNVIFVVVAVIGKYPQSDILIEESPNVTVDDNSITESFIADKHATQWHMVTN